VLTLFSTLSNEEIDEAVALLKSAEVPVNESAVGMLKLEITLNYEEVWF